MTDDARVTQQPRDVACAEPRDALEIESCERLAKRLALAEDRPPTQAGLESFEADLLEETPIVVDRKAPFTIVIGDIERVVADPVAAMNAIGDGGGHGFLDEPN